MTFGTEGFQVIPFLSAPQLGGIRSAISERVDAAIYSENIPIEKSFPGEPIERRIECISRLDAELGDRLLLNVYRTAHLDDRIAFLDGYSNLKTIAEDLVGTSITSFTIRVRANVPSLPARRQGWHSDVSVLDGGEFSKVKLACWVPLVDASALNGTLEIVPGLRCHPIAHNGDPENHTILEEDLDGHRKKVLDCSLGSAVFLDSFVPHRAIPNLSGEIRWSVVTWMMA